MLGGHSYNVEGYCFLLPLLLFLYVVMVNRSVTIFDSIVAKSFFLKFLKVKSRSRKFNAFLGGMIKNNTITKL